MSDIERIERRLSTVERAVVDGDLELAAVGNAASLTEDLAALTERIDTHEQRIADLEGRIDALDGLVGSVESVNEAVERRANGAVAAVDRLEHRIDELERVVDSRDTGDSGVGRVVPTDRDGGALERGTKTADGGEEPSDSDGAGIRGKTAAAPDSATDGYGRGALPSIDANEQADGSRSVEQTATEIVAAPTGEGESPNRQDGPGSDDRADSTATSADSTWSGRRATQDAIDCRLANPANGDRSSEGSASNEGAASSEDDEPGGGVVEFLRSKLP
ncbi:DUF7310 family coiled-coil domain-containing protein [Natrinema soli]|uniref:DUF7310 domain-containing protein n=1 Tax=Natrinema soli TaxID=1930624 RepID=A0ABD5SUP1_9EURY|nr:hypothetical protein [Natrinema soli]